MISTSAGAMSPLAHAGSTHRGPALKMRSQKFSPFSAHNASRQALCRSQSPDNEDKSPAPPTDSVKDALRAAEQSSSSRPSKRQADSTDFIATQLTRRFGIAGGLAWLGFLTFGVVSEQVKTRIEVAEAERETKDVAGGKEITTPEGIRYTDLRIGGGAPPQKGYLIILDYKAKANGKKIQKFFQENREHVGKI
jgi:hypothetical protein